VVSAGSETRAERVDLVSAGSETRAERFQRNNTMATRRERLEAMLLEQPTDPFLRYGLAIELAKEGDHASALDGLRQLMRDATPYVPAFFRAGQLLCELERISEARTALREGIDEARRQGNLHAAGEMSELLVSLGDFAQE
jgi:predicted Zn-dependent protease